MQFNADQLVGIIGAKELEIIILRQQLAAVQKRVEELEKQDKPQG
jgi:hypothetical protein